MMRKSIKMVCARRLRAQTILILFLTISLLAAACRRDQRGRAQP
jgi:hypothetical protein